MISLGKLDTPKTIDFRASPNLLGSDRGKRAAKGIAHLKAKSKAERVLYETRQKMATVRDTLAGHGPGGFPEPGELVRLTTFADINALTILLRSVDVFGSVDLVLASYSINQRAILALRQLLADGGITRATILGSDTITWRDPQRIREMHETADLFPDTVRFVVADNHAKVMCFHGTHDGEDHWIVCTGSANLASNARIEDYVLTNSEEGYRHYVGWIDEVMQPLPGPEELADKP